MSTPLFNGRVTPPLDLHDAARKSMNELQYQAFVAKYGDNFTPDQLAHFVTELRYGTRVRNNSAK